MATIVARDRLQCLVTPFEAVRTLCDMDSTFDARFHRGLAIALAGLSPCGVVFCSVLQCVAVCCSVFDVRLQRGLASLSQSFAVFYSVLLCVAVLWSCNHPHRSLRVCCNVFQQNELSLSHPSPSPVSHLSFSHLSLSGALRPTPRYFSVLCHSRYRSHLCYVTLHLLHFNTRMYIFVYEYMYICVQVCMCIYTCIYVRVYIYIFIYVYLCMYIYICMYINMYTCVFVCIYKHVCTYINMYIQMHTYMLCVNVCVDIYTHVCINTYIYT